MTAVHHTDPPRPFRDPAATRADTLGELDLQVLVAVAAHALCHATDPVHCGLIVVPDGAAPETLAATDDVPVRLAWLEHELGQGPELTPAASDVVVSKDLAADARWPDFGRLATAVLGLRAVVSVRVPVRAGGRAFLTFAARQPTALDRLDVDAALRLARKSAAVVNTVLRTIRRTRPADDVGDASRTAVALATVMARHRVDAERAFAMLQEASARCRRTLFSVALDVLATGCLPGEPVALATVSAIGGPEMWRSRPSRPAGGHP
jgi:hypothetical protein